MALTISLSDKDVQRRVEQELEWNPEVAGEELVCVVQSGIVTLKGTVDSYAKKLAAVEAAHQVRGVLDVIDQLIVRPPSKGRSDQEIAEAVRAALMWDVYVPDERIRSTVANGQVTLEGTVERWQQRVDAARAVQRLAGIRGLANKIEVRPTQVDPARIRDSIQDALTRRAEREAKKMQISVEDGVVLLKGTVDSWAEKNAVERLAIYTPGVKRIVNEIVVDPYS